MSSSFERTGISCHLLCAVPQLLDPNFHRSVVFMLDHADDGAMGLVLNNPMPNTLSEVSESLKLRWCGDPEAKVRLGGPVHPVRGWILHDQPEWDPEATEIAEGLQLTTSLKPIIEAGHEEFGHPESQFLFMLGSAGWAAGQLEGEIAAGSWVVVPVQCGDPSSSLDPLHAGVSLDWMFQCAPEKMWTEALAAIGVEPERLVGMHGGGNTLQ